MRISGVVAVQAYQVIVDGACPHDNGARTVFVRCSPDVWLLGDEAGVKVAASRAAELETMFQSYIQGATQ